MSHASHKQNHLRHTKILIKHSIQNSMVRAVFEKLFKKNTNCV